MIINDKIIIKILPETGLINSSKMGYNNSVKLVIFVVMIIVNQSQGTTCSWKDQTLACRIRYEQNLHMPSLNKRVIDK